MLVSIKDKQFSGTLVGTSKEGMVLRLKPYHTNNFVFIKKGKFYFVKK